MEWEISMIDIRDAGKLADFDSGRIFDMNNVQIKDHETLERIFVNAQICTDKAKLSDGDVLWLRDYNEDPLPDPVRIKVLEKLGNPDDSYRWKSAIEMHKLQIWEKAYHLETLGNI